MEVRGHPARRSFGGDLTPTEGLDAPPSGASAHAGVSEPQPAPVDNPYMVDVKRQGRDNRGVYIARALVQQTQFLAAVSQLSLPSQVISLTPRLGSDWNGNDAVFFQVVLADDSVPRNQLLTFTKDISKSIVTQLNPNEDWGVWPYFDFITQSEETRMKQPAWA